MREILFRGKRIDNGEWIYGDLIQDGKGYVGMWEQTPLSHNYKIDPSTVGQYTGLTANGKKIFEGDIVKGFYKPTDKLVCGSVKYENHLARMLILNRGVCAGLSHCHHVEVIGNIYDNPELLEDKQ